MKKAGKILLRVTACGLALSLLCGCTLTERLDETTSTLTNMTSDSQRQVGQVSLAYYTAEKINPITSSSTINRIICEALYEGLFCLNDKFEPEPVLCESYELNGTSCTLVLKEGLKFSDGSDVTADDVVYSYRLAKSTATSMYYNRASYMSSIRATDSRTIQITLSAPNSHFLSLLDIPIFKEGTENQTFSVGTGPFVASQSDTDYLLLPNENWHGGKVSNIPQINLVGTVRADAVISSFAAGDISLTRAERISDDPATIKGAVDVYQTPTTELHYLGVRMSHPLLSNENFRKALSLAIDRSSICRSSLQTFADPAVLPVNPQPEMLEDSRLTGALEQANTYLAQMGIRDIDGDGKVETSSGEEITLTLLCNSENSFKSNVCSQLVTAFSQIGIQLNINSLPFDQYQQALNSGNFDLYYGDVILTPDFDVRALLMSGGSLNYGRITDTTLDSKIMSVRTASADALEQAETDFYEYFLSKMPILPLAFERNQVIVRSGLLTGFSPRPYNIFWTPNEWRLG